VRGARVSVTQYYFRSTDGSCTGPYSAANDGYYAVGLEVPPSDLVKLSVGAPTNGARLAERFLTSSDGLAMPWTVHDSMLGVDCSPSARTQGAQSAVCAPAGAVNARYAHDAVCSVLELAVQNTCTPPQYAVNTPYTACPGDPAQYFTVGPQMASSPLYYQSGNSCITTTANATDSYYGLGTPVPVASMHRAPDALPGHRMQLIHMTAPDGLRWRDSAIYDAQLQAECAPATLPDGRTRCLPLGGYTITYFADSTCTTAIDLVEVRSGLPSCGAPAVPKFANKYVPPTGGGTCSYDYELHAMGPEFTDQVFTNYGACAPYTPGQTKFYRVGLPVDLTDFETVAVVTDQ
jgi:hypothetical protein